MFENADILSPNETEAEKLTGVIINNIEDAIKAGRILLENDIDKVVLLNDISLLCILYFVKHERLLLV